MGINWLSLNEWNERNEGDRGSQKRYTDVSLVSRTSYSELLEILPRSSMTPMDDEDGLGPCFRWFGQTVDGLPFFITCREYLPEKMHLNFPAKDTRSEKYQWSFIENLRGLPAPILKRIIWVRNEQSANLRESPEMKKCIFYRDEHGIDWEIYWAVSDDEAKGLLNLLAGLESEYEYRLGEAEDEGDSWIILKHSGNGEEKIVARYHRRCITEDRAREMSLENDALYSVRNERNGKAAHAFYKGKILRLHSPKT